MSEQPVSRVREIFEGAFELAPAERSAYLERECGADPALRDRVEHLLDSAEAEDVFLSEPTAAEAGSGGEEGAPAEAPGSTIGWYKLLEQIGEGGFGTVFLAEQEHPVRRRVALKIIKPGMDTRQVIARFEAERQALAMMDHPAIARVLDAGATGSGRPYFAMELVRGQPITSYCDEHSLTTRQRLQLFTQVCHAVQHAHQKGIIHRDIKPGNVLITVADGKPHPKVIDFGIAKAIESKLTQKTLFTEHRTLLGTPAYMSPEQAQMHGVDIDTRSDIYSLGVLLYELLTGVTPFDAERLRRADFDEMRRIIREEEPEKPSTRLSGLNGSLSRVAERRGTEPARLSALVRGDLDWIAMKALEKDRARRYETANGLALDVGRYLSGEPVLAAPPSTWYRMCKFARRHRAGATAASLVMLSLAAGVVGTTLGLVRAEQRRGEAVEAQRLAEERERQTQQVSTFQASMLRGIDVEAMGSSIKVRFRDQVRAALEREQVGETPDGRTRTREEVEAELAVFDERAGAANGVDVARGVMEEFVLGRAADALERRFADQPVVRARLHEALGATYAELGIYESAESHLQAAIELREEHHSDGHLSAEFVESWCELAKHAYRSRRLAEAEELFKKVLEMSREIGDEQHVAKTLGNIAGLYTRQNRFAEAEPIFDELLLIAGDLYGEESESYMTLLSNVAVMWSKQDKLAEAEDAHRRILQWRRDHFGVQDIEVAPSLHNLGHVLYRQGKHEEAERLFREALLVERTAHGEEHPVVANGLYTLGAQLVRMGLRNEGEDLYRQALELNRKLLSDEHPEVREILRDLAMSRLDDGDSAEAVELLREAFAIAEEVYPEGHPEVFRRFSTMSRLGVVLAVHARNVLATDQQRALELFEEAAELMTEGDRGYDSFTNSEKGRRAALRTRVLIFEFWHAVAPERGYGERAAEYQAQLDSLPPP